MGKLLHNKKLIGLLLISILSVFVGAMIAPFEMRFVSGIVKNNSLASFTFTIGTIASMVGIIAFTGLTNKFGREKILKIGLLISIVFPFMYANIYSILNIYELKFAWTFLLAGINTIMTAYIQTLIAEFKDYEGRLYGALYSVQAGIGFFGALLGGAVSDFFGLKYIFYVAASIAAIEFIIMFICFYEKESTTGTTDIESKIPNIWEGIKFIWQNNQLRARFIVVTTTGINWSAKVILYPLIIFSICNSNTLTGTILGIQGIVAMITLPAIGALIDKAGYIRVLWIGCIILGLALIIFGISNSMWIAWLAIGMIAMGDSCSGTAMSILEVKNIPEDMRNSIVGVHNLYATTVEIIATIGIGLLLINFSPNTLILILGVMVFVALILARLSIKKVQA